ncbi:MAG: hypothetical protein L0Y67_01450, partial [Gammaproteobacteria bacterium]|nr:hypothetical protein [Gammaproteobacteria bacterium]
MQSLRVIVAFSALLGLSFYDGILVYAASAAMPAHEAAAQNMPSTQRSPQLNGLDPLQAALLRRWYDAVGRRRT